ncbi:MAG: hypothetical protein RBS29_02290 [Bacteroidales bacterium]|nr:hypothetical protein [Bacteroidales bacterium]
MNIPYTVMHLIDKEEVPIPIYRKKDLPLTLFSTFVKSDFPHFKMSLFL